MGVHNEIIIASLSLIGVLATAFVAVKKIRITNKELLLAEKELEFQSHALSFGAFLEDWQGTSREMRNLMRDTEIDRILIFRAWNGSLAPKWTTAVYQMREEGQEPIQYVHFELDEDYVERLRKIVSNGILTFSVDQIEDSFIKSVYNAEGVKSSCWAYINSQQPKDSDAVSISYASFSSTESDRLSPDTVTKCRILAGRLKGLASNFDLEAEANG